jgi:hypothetical protein
MVALEAVRLVSEEYGIPTGALKPCVAFLLDGNPPTTDRHKVAFTIAIELRGLGWTQEQVADALARWARKIGYRVTDAQRALKSAFRKKPNGDWQYHPPGLKKERGVYRETLKPICDEVGCPANCPAFANKFSGPIGETFDRFTELGWATFLKKRRWRADIDVYEAICRREKQLGLAPGVELLTSYRQLSDLAGVNKTTVGDALRRLAELGLVSFQAGSGSGPHARDRVPSRVSRVVPIPLPPGSPMSAIRAGGGEQPHIGSGSHRAQAHDRYYQSWGGLTGSDTSWGRTKGSR